MTVWHDTYEAPSRANPMAPAPEAAVHEHGLLDLSFFASLAVSLGSMVDEMRRTNDRAQRQLDRALDRIPADTAILGQGTTNATGAAIIACNGPSLSRQWQVRQLAVVGPTKGTVSFYACPAPPVVGQALGFKDSTKSRWPAPAFYGTHQFVVNPPEVVFVVVATATATTQVVVNGTAETYALDDLPSVETL